jgi:hypothetical protein
VVSADRIHVAARPRWLAVAALLLAAALFRVAALFYHEISGDDATVALIAKHALAGENFPVFFYRQTYIGALSGYHLVPALFLVGPSVLLVRLHEVLWNLPFLLGLYLLVRRLYGEPAGLSALALGAVSPFLLTYWSSVAEPHFTTNTVAVLLLLLALAALEAGRGPRYVRLLAVLGLTAGLGWWQNFKTLEVLAPVLLVLWLRNPRLPLSRAGLACAGGFLAGSLPAWLFYATRGDAPGYAQRLFQTDLHLSGHRLAALFSTVAPTLLGTYYWPTDTAARRAALAAVGLIFAAAVALAVAEALRRPWAGPGAGAAKSWTIRLLLAVLVLPFALVYASRYVPDFDHETARYVLPAYVPLLAFAGALIGWIAQRTRAVAVVLLLGLLGFNVWTNAAFFWPLDAAERARRREHVARREALIGALRSGRVDALYVDEDALSFRFQFLLDLPVSETASEIYVPSALAADAARRIAILHPAVDPTLPGQLAQLGARHRTTRFGPLALEDEISVPARGYRAIPRGAWRLAGAPEAVPPLADGDLATAAPGDGGAGDVVVDLGAEHAVGRVVWWPPTEREHTHSVAVAGSRDGRAWTPLGEQPSFTHARRAAYVAGGRPVFRPRQGWLELRVAAAPVRYLRFAPADPRVRRGWGVTELAVYEETGEPGAAEPDARGVTARLKALDVRRLLADPVVSARVARASAGTIAVLPANGVLDNHGRARPPARLGAPVHLQPGDGLLVPGEEGEPLVARLRAESVAFREERIGDWLLVHGLAPVPATPRCRRTPWRVASGGSGPPGHLLAPVIEARLQEAGRVLGVRVEHPLVSSRHVTVATVEVSADGSAWRRVPAAGRVPQWGWAGLTLFAYSDAIAEIAMPATEAAHVRVTLTLPDVEGRASIRSLCVRSLPAA